MRLLNLIIILSILGFAFSCKKNETVKSSEAELLKVTCSFGEGVIDTEAKTVTMKAPETTDITQITVQFEISDKATIFPGSGTAIDFTNPVTLTVTAEDKVTITTYTMTVIKPIVEFTVKDCSNWSPTNFYELQANATIKVYINVSDINTENTYELLTTDTDAKAILYGSRENTYYFIAEKDNKSNIIDGYLLLGTYNNQAEVDASMNTDATVGGLRFYDVNADGIINNEDKLNCDLISNDPDLSGSFIFQQEVFIAE